MTIRDDMFYTRRLFLQHGVTFASMVGTAPLFIQNSARAVMLPLDSAVSSRPGVAEDRILVVVQLGGGNDGLNTVVPFGDRAYYNARPSLSIGAPGKDQNNLPGALTIDGADGVGLHPNLEGFKQLMDDGVASIVQGVGYPNPNRSHFASMDIWHTAKTSGSGNGWIGRYFDNTCNGTPLPEGEISIGREAPLAMVGQVQKPVSFESAQLFRWTAEDQKQLKRTYDELTRSIPPKMDEGNKQLEFLTRTALDAQDASSRIRAAVSKPSLVQYPGSNLAQQLRMVGAMIRAGINTRVYYVSMGGFDTHANQIGTHANLMRQLGDALRAFHDDMKQQDNSGRVLTMVFSEFGRRVAQNGSNGTDHGTAAPMYFVGDMIRPGLLGNHPSLTNLDQGDLVYNVDFRCIYATILEDWLGAPSVDVLGDVYRKAQILA